MTMYVTQPRRRDWDLNEYGEQHAKPTYSLAEIVFLDGTKHEFMVSAGPTVVPHLIKEMKGTGYLTLWNDTDTFCVRADGIKHFALREITSK